MDKTHNQTDVLIIGAGLAGLSAGKELKEKEIDYTIIEATDRPGGKVWSYESQKGNRFFEMGAQFVNQDMTEIVRLIEESGMTLEKTSDSFHSVQIDSVKKRPVDNLIKEAQMVFETMDFEKDKPLSQLYGNITEEWRKKVLRSSLTEMLNVNVNHISSIGIAAIMESYHSEEDDMTHQSSGPLKNVITYLEGLSKESIRYKDPLQSVKHTDEGYRVKTESGQVYEAGAVILAIPPTVASRLDLSEDLTKHYLPLLESFTDGAVIKQTLVYKKPFWHDFFKDEKRVKGIIYTDSIGFTVSDSTTETSEPRLTLFIGGDKAKELAVLTREQRDVYVMSRLVEVLGVKAQQYVEWNEDIWVDHPFYGGGYGAKVLYGKNPYAAKKLSKAFGKCIFANTEVAPAFKNFMEGAIRSGQFAAKEISRLL